MIQAVLRDGREVTIDPARHGHTIEEMVASLTGDALTGSAVPLADAILHTVPFGTVSYSDINQFNYETFESKDVLGHVEAS